MYRILALNGRSEIAFSINSEDILNSKKIISSLAEKYKVSFDDNDLIRAKNFSEKFNIKELVFILNEEGMSFLPKRYFVGKRY